MSTTLALLLVIPAVVGWVAILTALLWVAVWKNDEDKTFYLSLSLVFMSVIVACAFGGDYGILNGATP